MQLHQLPSTRFKAKKRVGRGGKRGNYSGRGMKGQKARAGRKLRLFYRDTILKYPKLRGKSFRISFWEAKRIKPQVFNLDDISKLVEQKKLTKINQEVLYQYGLIKKSKKKVKILGDGEIDKPIEVELPVSKTAKQKIEKAGGKVIEKIS